MKLFRLLRRSVLPSLLSVLAFTSLDLRADSSRLLDLSARGVVGTGDNVLIGGFVIPSGSAKTVLIRAVGPTLTSLSVSGALANPTLTVYNSSGTAVATNDDWDATLASTFSTVGAFSLTSGSKDSAITATLSPGAYSVIVSGVNSTTGVAMVEIYETDSANALINLATRGQVGTGDSVLIAGFVVSSGSTRRLLVRGIGPGLTAQGVSGALADPKLTLYNSAGTALAANDNWGTPVTANDASPATLATAFTGSGAFSLTSGSADSALLVTLGAGAYSVIVNGVNSTTGVGMAEIYDVTGLGSLPTETAPAITSQPAAVSTTAGASATFSVTASGTAPLTYQWYKASAAISGATASSYTLSSVAASDAASYSVVVTNALGSTTSTTAALSVTTTTTSSNTAAVVAAAQAFLATLSSTQQSATQLAWSLDTGRKWSNLPATFVARNGVAWGALTTAQKAAASTLISTALSTAGNTLWVGMQAADDYLAANGGGTGSYGAGYYYISCLGTPSTSSFWVLQLTGHHLTYNISYNGNYQSGTPLFLGVEPKGSFTQSSVTYDPMSVQRLAMADLASSLSSYAAAALSGTYSDILFGANGTGGIDGTYPKSYPTGTSGRGVLYSALSTTDQAKVQAVIKSYVNTQASDVSAELLSAYLSDTALASTYVAYSGSANVTTANNYFRVDGPRVWIEFSVPKGVIFSSDIHYHTIWRDKVADYGGKF